ncbi:RNA polymerase sigma factor [Streptomyces sp. NPDC002701]|uniref:RNA polymerase sigma factor n=1 Tax=Streptomyces sp. NPDC002701 TaxID=3364661 RepID=UPI00369BA612
MDSESDEYTAFFQHQYPRVVSMLIAYRGFTPEIAEDAAAEAMTRLLLHWRKVAMPQAWVRTVALRHAYLLKKKQQALLPDPAVVDHGAVDDLAAVELALITGSAIAVLPPRQREVMTLTLVDMTPSEIAEVLGCTPGQARDNLAHAQRAVSSAIQKEAGGGPDTQHP